jgi:hypothetical protein
MSMVKIAAGMDYEDARPLMEELMACVQIVPDPSRPDVMRSDIVHDVEEVATLMKLKLETYKLHTSFSPLAVTSTSTSTTSQAGQAPSRSTRTSPGGEVGDLLQPARRVPDAGGQQRGRAQP